MHSFWAGFYKEAEAMKQVATVAIISVDDRKMLMGKRRDNRKWTTPGGHLDHGETPHAGAVREVKEESGIDLGEDDLIHIKTKTVTKPNGSKIKVHAFKSFVNGTKPDTTNKDDPDNEFSVMRWFKMRGGLPPHVVKNLHVPLPENILLQGLNFKKSAAISDMVDPESAHRILREGLQQYVQRGLPKKRRKQQEKTAKDLIPGGLADKKTDKDFPRKSILRGAKVESEHTSDQAIAHEIARDHLSEDPKYYQKLKKMEKGSNGT